MHAALARGRSCFAVTNVVNGNCQPRVFREAMDFNPNGKGHLDPFKL